MADLMPEQESTILTYQENNVIDADEQIEESKEVEASEEKMLSSAAICNDLEILLETGYAQLN